jgi:crotonobetainyl-CoA:carnitine CoA-transferase CaiB-like acyl-CoA transferase
MMHEGALDGLRVVEFAHAVAGPFCGSMLADFGAEVIKVEQTGVGDSLRRMGPWAARSLWFTVSGRNKRSIEANLKDPTELARVKQLVASADVVIGTTARACRSGSASLGRT